jgi:hypothetical protein
LGAIGYVLKQSPKDEILQSLREALDSLENETDEQPE